MEYHKLFSKYGLFLIRYDLETVGGSAKRRIFKVTRELADLDRSARRHWERALEYNVVSKTPFFHPGRVFVSREVMVYLGRIKVLVYLNLFVRGDWFSVGDGLYQGGPSWIGYRFGKDVELVISTNAAETRTVVRFRHEHVSSLRNLLKNAAELEPAPEKDPDRIWL